jgi:outer membrane protein TolC
MRSLVRSDLHCFARYGKRVSNENQFSRREHGTVSRWSAVSRTTGFYVGSGQMGVAKSAYYPLINLGASGAFESSSITTLLNGPSDLWSVGASAAVTVFDVGRRHALTDQARAAYDGQVAAYRENVLTGFQQVEDNLAAVRILENEAKVQDEAVVAAQRSLDLSIKRYKRGSRAVLR